MKVALVHDWFTEMGGAEKVFRAIYDLYPEADIYTLICNNNILDKLNIDKNRITTSFIQRLPFAKKKYRNYLPFFTTAIESFDLSKYDLIISSSYAVAKGVLVHTDQIHICYCHSPVRYAWDLYHQYLKEAGLIKGLKSVIVKHVLHKLRIWDVISSNRVNYFVSNSNYIAHRIQKVYRREATTIYPNVDVCSFLLEETKDDYYITCSRLVPYKKVDLIVKAFALMPDKKLVVIGDGPDMDKIKAITSKNVNLMGYQPFEVLLKKMQKAKAFIFAAEEDFGIASVEAQACGTPVIAFGKGGSLETIVNGKTGVLFYEQTELSIIDAVNKFESKLYTFDSKVIRSNAERFSTEYFMKNFRAFVDTILYTSQIKHNIIEENNIEQEVF